MAKYDSRLDHLRGTATVSELAAPHDMALPSFLAHLRKLEEAGLVTTTKQGRTRVCALAPDSLTPAQDWLSAQKALWSGRLDRLDDYVINLMKEKGDGPGPGD